jgi:hypothetical protein
VIPRSELVKQLAASLGYEKAEEVLTSTASQLGIAADPLNKTETLEILDQMLKTPGLVGVVARFVKVRVLLRATTTS